MIERIEINLLPAEYRFHRRKIHLPREVIYPIIFSALLFGGLAFWHIIQQNSISYYKNQIVFLEQQINQNRPIQREINALRSDKISIQQKIRALERINVNREKWVRLMEELSSRLPQYTWLVSIKEDNSNIPMLSVEGRTYSFPDIPTYMSSLKECPYIKSIDLSNIEQIDPKKKIFRFFITCMINPDVNLHPEEDGMRTSMPNRNGNR